MTLLVRIMASTVASGSKDLFEFLVLVFTYMTFTMSFDTLRLFLIPGIYSGVWIAYRADWL
jgi:hypothetical protein